MLRSYIETALWSSHVLLPCAEDELVNCCMDVDENHLLYGVSERYNLDEYFDYDDCSEEFIQSSKRDLDDFVERLEMEGLLENALEYGDLDQIAHDFWLTRNGHGAGFWDGDYGDIGDRLTDIAKEWSEVTLFVTLEGKICI